MAAQVIDDVLQFVNSVLEDYKSECDNLPKYFERNLMLQNENQEKSNGLLADATKVLEGLKKEYVDGEEEGTNLNENGYAENSFEANKEKMMQKEAKIAEEIKLLQEKQNECKEDSLRCLHDLKDVEARKEALTKESSEFIPWKKDVFALFTTTTGIRWNFGCNDKEIRGYVAGKKDVKPFSINADEHYPSHISNYLWDVVGSAFDA